MATTSMSEAQVISLLVDGSIALEEKLDTLYRASQFCAALTLLDQNIDKVRQPKKILTSISRAMNHSYRWGKSADYCGCWSCYEDLYSSTHLLPNAALLLMQTPAMRRQPSAFSATMLRIIMYYPAEQTLITLVLEAMQRKRLRKEQIRGMLKGYQVNSRHVELLKQWIELTSYTLDFDDITIDLEACDSQFVILLERALREKRFPKSLLVANAAFVNYLFNVFPQSCTEMLARHCFNPVFGWWIDSSWRGADICHYQASYINNDTWPIIQHQRYLNYALCLASIEGVTPYVIVWIVENWIIPTHDVKHLRGVRIAESVIKAYNNRAAAASSTQKATILLKKKRNKI